MNKKLLLCKALKKKRANVFLPENKLKVSLVECCEKKYYQVR